jgi:hypothetical protein
VPDLLPYDLARAALAEARSVDDVKDILDKAAAMAEYRRRAGDRTLEIDAIEIRMFAERRLGQMIAAQKQTVGLNKGTLRRGTAEEPRDERPTLAEAGIDKKLSAKAQKMAAIPPEQFKAKLSAWREEALTSDRVVTNLLHVGQKEEQAAARRELASTLADTSADLAEGRKVPCIYLDPAYARKAGIGDRAYENHYPTEKWDGILDIMKKASNRLQPNAWAFIWIPRAHMLALHPVKYTIATDDGARHDIEIKTPLIWAIARALGCTDYSTCFVWTKTDEEHPDEHGTFLIARDQDEILCLYKKGDGLPRPAPEFIYGSNHRERSRPLGHSVKPPFYRKMIKDMVGCDRDGKPLPVLELFARHDKDNPLPENWESWGNESSPSPSGDVATRSDGGVEGHPPQATGEAESADVRQIAGVESGPSETNSASDDDRVIEDSSSEHAGNLNQTYLEILEPEHHRWEDEGGRSFGDDLVVIRPQRATRR